LWNYCNNLYITYIVLKLGESTGMLISVRMLRATIASYYLLFARNLSSPQTFRTYRDRRQTYRPFRRHDRFKSDFRQSSARITAKPWCSKDNSTLWNYCNNLYITYIVLKLGESTGMLISVRMLRATIASYYLLFWSLYTVYDIELLLHHGWTEYFCPNLSDHDVNVCKFVVISWHYKTTLLVWKTYEYRLLFNSQRVSHKAEDLLYMYLKVSLMCWLSYPLDLGGAILV
jgi:hypothetical protein